MADGSGPNLAERVSRPKPGEKPDHKPAGKLPGEAGQPGDGRGNADFFAGQERYKLPEPKYLAQVQVSQAPKGREATSPATGTDNEAKDKHKKGPDAADVVKSEIKDLKSTQRERLSYEGLVSIVDRTFKDPKQKKELLDNLAKLKDRAGKDKIDQADLERHYHQIGRACLASVQGNERFTPDEMRQLALDFSLHGGKPGTTDQGNYPTCQTAAPESVIYGMEPYLIAGMVADVAINGQFVTADGTVIKPKNDSLHENNLNRGDKESARSLANRIAQVTLINVYWGRQDKATTSVGGNPQEINGKFSYEEGGPRQFITDNGSRIVDYSTSPPRVITDSVFPFDPTREIPGPGQNPNAPRAPKFSIERPEINPGVPITALHDIYRQIGGTKNDFTVVAFGQSPPIKSPKTREEFKTLLEDAKAGRNGVRLPLVLAVDVSDGPMAEDSSLPRPADTNNKDKPPTRADILHVVAIFDYDSKTGLVDVENQWGEANDHTGQPGSKRKLTLDEVNQDYLRVGAPIDTNNRDFKLGKPEDYIADQKKYIDELLADSRVKPEQILQERLTLHRYLNHWGFKDEANKLADQLKNDYLKVVNNPDKVSGDSAVYYGSRVANILHQANKDAEIKPILDGADAICKTELANLNSTKQTHRELESAKETFRSLIDLHLKYGDKAQIAGLHKEILASASDNRIKVAMTEEVVDSLQDNPGQKASIPTVLAAADEAMRNSTFRDMGSAQSDSYAYLALQSLHKRFEDQVSAKVVDDIAAGLKRLQPKTAEEKVAHLDLTISAARMAAWNGYPDKAAAQLDSIMAAQREMERHFGIDSPQVTGSKGEIIDLYLKTNKKNEAAKVAEELQATYDRLKQKNLSERESRLDNIRPNLQDAYERLGNWSKVDQLIDDSLKAIENKLDFDDNKQGPDHVKLLDPLSRAAALYERNNQLQKAAQFLERALAIALKNKHFEAQCERLPLRRKLAAVYKKMGQTEKAEKLLKEASKDE